MASAPANDPARHPLILWRRGGGAAWCGGCTTLSAWLRNAASPRVTSEVGLGHELIASLAEHNKQRCGLVEKLPQIERPSAPDVARKAPAPRRARIAGG